MNENSTKDNRPLFFPTSYIFHNINEGEGSKNINITHIINDSKNQK